MANYEINGNVVVTQNATLLGTTRENNLFRATFENTVAHQQVAIYNVDCFADIRNFVKRPDGTVELDFYGITTVRAYTTKETGITGYRNSLKMFGDVRNNGNLELIYEHEVDLGEGFDTGIKTVNGSSPIHLVIPPGEQRQIPLRRVVRWFADALISDDEFYMDIGGYIKNPVELYIPCAIRQGLIIKSLNDTPKKYIKRRNLNSWNDFSWERVETKMQAGQGKSRIRIGGSFRQAPITTTR